MFPSNPTLPLLAEPQVIYEEVFCICNRPFQGFMVTCDSCGNMFHGVCVGLTPASAAKRDGWTCKSCTSRRPARATPRPLRRSNTTTPAGESTVPSVSPDELRSKVRTSFCDVLGESAESARTAAAIENILHASTQPEKLYRSRARIIATNLRDARNGALRERLLKGEITPAALCAMSVDELAPPEVANYKRARQQEMMQAVVLPAEAFEVVQSQPWDLHHHYMASLEYRSLSISSSSLNEEREDKKEEREEENTTKPPAAAEQTIQTLSLPELEKSGSSLGGDHRDDSDEQHEDDASIDRRPVLPVDLNIPIVETISTPLSANLLSPPSLNTSQTPSTTFWEGQITCHSMTPFRVNAKLLPGQSNCLSLLPSSLHITGRSPLSSLVKYASALLSSSSRTRSILYLSPSSPSDEPHLTALITELSRRDRGAVCKLQSSSSSLQDVFLLPSVASSPLTLLLGNEKPPHSGDLLLVVVVQSRG